MSFDRVARAYRWLEYAAFGRALWRCRIALLSDLGASRRVLMLGDGDGRFLSAFLRTHPDAQVDWVDQSAAMARLARSRLSPSEAARVTFHHADALRWTPPQVRFDTIITHFFLDCLSDEDVTQLAATLAGQATDDAQWIVSEFTRPARQPWRFGADVLLPVMYAFFRWTTGLQTRRLPDFESGLRNAGFVCQSKAAFLKGLLSAQRWRRRANLVS